MRDTTPRKHIKLDAEAHRIAKAAAAAEGCGLERWIAIAIAEAAETTATRPEAGLNPALARDAERLLARRTFEG